MAEPPLLELRGIGFRRGDCDILQGVDWSVRRGRHWAILGPNGSGKTTLLRVACGYEWPTAGVVLRDGQELVDLGELRRRMAWVAARLIEQIPPGQRAVETVVSGLVGQIGLRRFGDQGPTTAAFDAARAVLADLGCAALAEKPIAVLSQGERQQVLFARARLIDPVLIVLDEPCAGMDPGVRERFLAWMEATARADGSPAIILVTHHVDEIMPAFGETLVLSGGRVVAQGATRDVVTASLLEELYGAPMDRIEQSGGRLWPIWR